MREISIIKQRILLYLDSKGISKYECYQNTGITNGVLSQNNGMSEENILRFLSYYTDINLEWLFSGIGNILKNEKSSTIESNQSDQTIFEKNAIISLLKEQLTQLRIEMKGMDQEIGALKAELSNTKKETDIPLFKTEDIDQSSLFESPDVTSARVPSKKHTKPEKK